MINALNKVFSNDVSYDEEGDDYDEDDKYAKNKSQIDNFPDCSEKEMKISRFEGYENVNVTSFNDQNANYSYLNPNSNFFRPPFQEIRCLDENEAKASLANYVIQNSYCDEVPLQNLTFTKFQPSNSYIYLLETFTETRTTYYDKIPYMGEEIIRNDKPLPQPWSINAQPNALFENHDKYIEIPNTAEVESCYKCGGVGNGNCSSCMGRGTKPCQNCAGQGYKTNFNNGREKCNRCNGNGRIGTKPCQNCAGQGYKTKINNGREKCYSCGGLGIKKCNFCHDGRIKCNPCSGGGQLKRFLRLEVSFKNNVDYVFKKTMPIPDDLLRTCPTAIIFAEQNNRVYPIANHQDQDVNLATQRLISAHAAQFAQYRILMQRHQIKVIPTTLCSFVWKGKTHTYYVYGIDNRVYAPDYPKKSNLKRFCSIL